MGVPRSGPLSCGALKTSCAKADSAGFQARSPGLDFERCFSICLFGGHVRRSDAISQTSLAGYGKTRPKASVQRVLANRGRGCQTSGLAGVLIKMMLTMMIQHRTRHGAVAVVPHPTAL